MISVWRFLIMVLSGVGTSFIRTWQAFRRGKKEGAAEVKQEAAAKTEVIHREAKEVRNEVNALPDGDLKRRAGKWVRNPKSSGTPKGDE